MWNERYAEDGFAYGTEPNTFLVQYARTVAPGRALDVAGGEGRNGLYLAGLGHRVTIVDGSSVGLAKARALAEERALAIETIEADLAAFEPSENAYDLIVSIWAHVPPIVRRALHARLVHALAPGGVFVLESYTPAQVARSTGGPRDPALCMTLDALRDELAGLTITYGVELDRDVQEGKYHQGMSSVVQVVAQKPSLIA
jgi:SAM-dependent methyltransferase